MKPIKTERLTLKRGTLEHKSCLIQLIGDFRVASMLSSVPHPYTDEDADYWLGKIEKDELNLNIFLYVVLIGGVGLAVRGDDYCELGYWLGFEYWGFGYATEACKGLLEFAQISTSFNRVNANVYKRNFGSSKVLQKLGFEQVGEGEVFSLSRQQNMGCLHYEYLLAGLGPRVPRLKKKILPELKIK